MSRPLAVDLFCGLGGWTEGLLAEGYDVVGFDVEQHVYGAQRYPAQLVLQDVRTIHGSQFRDAALIVASSPCQKYSYMAMPWTRAKKLAEWYRESPERLAELNELFVQPARIQREACEAAGRFIPMVQENVKGAQPWVGRANWHFGSFYLWGDVPALMPTSHSIKNRGGSWFAIGSPGQQVVSQNPVHDGRKGVGGGWFHDATEHPLRRGSSKSLARKAASAHVAKIPAALASHIGHVYHPNRQRGAA